MNALPNGAGARWSHAQDDVAHRMWIKGVSATEIGAAVGRTRMSVIGRAFREGWGFHPTKKNSGAWGAA